MRACRECLQSKPLDSFRVTKGRHRHECRECERLHARTRWAALPDDKKKSKSPAKAREYQLKAKYGITPEDYNSLFAAQGGVCAVCSRPQGRLHVDHDHSGGAVRGLLCGACNRALGLLKDNTGVLASAIRYLNRSKQNV
jgi:hypothetical protein